MFSRATDKFDPEGAPLASFALHANLSSMFRDCSNFGSIYFDNWDVSKITNMSHMFQNAGYLSADLSNWDVSSVIDMSYLFYNSGQNTGDLKNWNVSSVIDMSYMCYGIYRLNGGDLRFWDVSSVRNMSHLFHNTQYYNWDLSRWNVSSVIDIIA